MSRHVMLDLETMGRSPGCAIRSVGAVSFDLETNKIDETTFYANIDPKSCWKYGLHIEQETEDWWAKQPAEVVKHLETNQQSIFAVVRNFNAWHWQQNAVFLWCNGASFDAPIWEAAVRATEAKVPSNYWQVRCARTMCYLAGIEIHKEPRKSARHNALEDALHQVRCVQKAFKLLGLHEDAKV